MRTPFPGTRRPRRYRYAVLAVAAVLVIGLLTVNLTQTGHLGWLGWLSLGVLATAIVSTTVVTRRRRLTRPGRTSGGSRGTPAPPKPAKQGGQGLASTANLLGIVAAALSIIQVILAMTTTASGQIPVNPSTSDPATSSSPAPPRSTSPSDPCATQLAGPARHDINVSHNLQSSVQLKELFFSVIGDDRSTSKAQEWVDMYGRLAGSIPPGDSIWVIGVWDSRTRSQSTHQPGYDKYAFPRGPLHVNTNGCFNLETSRFGNPGTYGISEDNRVVLADKAQARKLAATEQEVFITQKSTLLTADLGNLGMPVANFEIPTSPYVFTPGIPSPTAGAGR